MTIQDNFYRVVFHASRDGKPFLVQKRSTMNRSKWSKVASFGTLPRALREYPNAAPDAISETSQRHIESAPHTFNDREGRGECWTCGNGATWPAHMTRLGGGK